MQFPKHKCTLYLVHNEHLSYYETVKESIEDGYTYKKEAFIDEADMQVCIETNECWSLQWYPNTPIGSHLVHASTLEKVLQAAMEEEKEGPL